MRNVCVYGEAPSAAVDALNTSVRSKLIANSGVNNQRGTTAGTFTLCPYTNAVHTPHHPSAAIRTQNGRNGASGKRAKSITAIATASSVGRKNASTGLDVRAGTFANAIYATAWSDAIDTITLTFSGDSNFGGVTANPNAAPAPADSDSDDRIDHKPSDIQCTPQHTTTTAFSSVHAVMLSCCRLTKCDRVHTFLRSEQ